MNPVLADSFTLSSRADLADVTISFARHTVLIDARARFAESKWATSVSRERSASCCECECDGEPAGDRDPRLPSAGEDDIVVDSLQKFKFVLGPGNGIFRSDQSQMLTGY